ncbi:MAG: hypothetical protein ACI4BI_00515 [Anaerotardibacter sp.]
MTFLGQHNAEAKARALMGALFAMQSNQNAFCALMSEHMAQQSSCEPAIFAQHVAQQSVRQNPAVFSQHVAQQSVGKLNTFEVRYC